MAFSGARVRKASDATTQNFTSATVVTWDTEVFDVGGWYDTVVSTSAFTIPSGVEKVRVGCSIRCTLGGATDWWDLILRKNGSASFDGAVSQTAENATASGNRSFTSGPIPCSPGDTFDVTIQVEADTSQTVTAAQSNFWIEKVA